MLVFSRFEKTNMTSIRLDITDEIYITDLVTENDIPSWIKYLNNPTIYANTLLIPCPYTQKDGEEFLRMVKSSSSESSKLFMIRLKENDELIGSCGFYRSDNSKHRAEIGYWLGEPFWRRGWMPKVVQKAVESIRTLWPDVVRVEAAIFPWNQASKRVVEKSGFVFEGILRKYYYKDGKAIDGVMYAVVFD